MTEAFLSRQQQQLNNDNVKPLHHDKPPLSKSTSGLGRKPLQSLHLNNSGASSTIVAACDNKKASCDANPGSFRPLSSNRTNACRASL
mmetsp:Transcript_29968/g.82254  ORF Transcript_29968/g.82254 Transcript_29968/m.82254 type:complete len:88 (-) Transcript_29968:844-1107(-)